MYPSFENLNYQQQISSIIPTFGSNGNYISPMNESMYLFKNRFGNTVPFRKSELTGTVNGKRYEVFASRNNKQIRIGRRVVLPGNKVNIEGAVFTVTNIGPKQVIVKKGNTTRKFKIRDFISELT
jgi:hypothetical protein